MSWNFLPIFKLRHIFWGLGGLLLLSLLVSGSWFNLVLLAGVGIAAYLGIKNLKAAFTFGVNNSVWRYGTVVGSGLLVAMIAAWAFLGWTTILFLVGALAVALLSYAIVLALQRMSLPNSIINITTDVRLRAPRFRNWGRYVLKAEITTEIIGAKGKTKRLHTKRMYVKVHKEDFPEGRLVEACHSFVQSFVEKEQQLLLRSYPNTPLMVDQSYFQQVKNLALPIPIKQQPQTEQPSSPICGDVGTPHTPNGSTKA